MRGKGLILATLCLAALIINLDTTIVNVALPSLVRQTGATTTDLQWVVDAYNVVFAALVLAAGSLSDRLGQAPATEAIMGAVPKQKAGVASAVNGSTRLFGGTLGVAVIGSVAASLYTSRLAALLPAGLPDRAVTAAKGSVGGAAAAAEQLTHTGLAGPGRRLAGAAELAFMHSLTGACLVAAGVAAIGFLLVVFLLPARPGSQRASAHPAASTAAADSQPIGGM